MSDDRGQRVDQRDHDAGDGGDRVDDAMTNERFRELVLAVVQLNDKSANIELYRYLSKKVAKKVLRFPLQDRRSVLDAALDKAFDVCEEGYLVGVESPIGYVLTAMSNELADQWNAMIRRNNFELDVDPTDPAGDIARRSDRSSGDVDRFVSNEAIRTEIARLEAAGVKGETFRNLVRVIETVHREHVTKTAACHRLGYSKEETENVLRMLHRDRKNPSSPLRKLWNCLKGLD